MISIKQQIKIAEDLLKAGGDCSKMSDELTCEVCPIYKGEQK